MHKTGNIWIRKYWNNAVSSSGMSCTAVCACWIHVCALRKAEGEWKEERESSFGRGWRCNTKALAGPLVKHWGLLLGYILINTLVCRLSSPHVSRSCAPPPAYSLLYFWIKPSLQQAGRPQNPRVDLMLMIRHVHSEEMSLDHSGMCS